MSKIVKITKAKKRSKNHIGFLGLFLIVSIMCFLLLSPIFAIDTIEVVGNEVATEKYIISSSGILYGENILKMNKFDAIEKINSVPVIESSKIKRQWPNKIIITVTEKEPIAEVKFYGSKLLVAENGDVISVITDNSETNLPILEGITVKDVMVGNSLICDEEEKYKNYLEVLKKLKENDMLIDVVKLSDKDGILVSFAIGHVVFFGDTDNLQYKIELLKGILEKEENSAYIDLHNLESIITKPVWGMLEKNQQSENTNNAENTEEIRSVEGEE